MPYLTIALALLAGSVLGSLYAFSTSEDGAAPVMSRPGPPAVDADPFRRQAFPASETFGVSAVALASITPERIVGAAAWHPDATSEVPAEAGAAAPDLVALPPPGSIAPPMAEGAGRPEAPAEPTAWDKLYDAFYQLGYAFQLQGASDEAIEVYRRAAELHPAHAATFYNWGYVLQQNGAAEAAIDKYHQALNADPEHFYAHYNLGYLLQQRGNIEEAVGHYQQAAALDSTNPYVYYNWGYILESRGDTAEALRLYARALEIAPDRRPGTDAQQRIAHLHAEKTAHAAPADR